MKHMKIKIINDDFNGTGYLETEVNEFIAGKKVYFISYTVTRSPENGIYRECLIIYSEIES